MLFLVNCDPRHRFELGWVFFFLFFLLKFIFCQAYVYLDKSWDLRIFFSNTHSRISMHNMKKEEFVALRVFLNFFN